MNVPASVPLLTAPREVVERGTAEIVCAHVLDAIQLTPAEIAAVPLMEGSLRRPRSSPGAQAAEALGSPLV